MKKNLILTFLVLIISVLLIACGNSNDDNDNNGNENSSKSEKTIMIGHSSAEDIPAHQASVEFGELVNEKSNGELTVEVYSNSSLGTLREMLESTQNGTLDITLSNSAAIAPFIPEILALNIPYLFESNEDLENFINSDASQELMGSFEDHGFVGLAWMDNGVRHIVSNNKISSPSDIKGDKIRLVDNPIHIDVFEALGFTTSTMDYSEVFSALQQGVIDAMEGSYSNVEGMGFHEAANYVNETAHIYDIYPILFSKEIWDELSEEHQEIIRESAIEAAEKQREAQKEEDSKVREEFLASDEIEVNELSDEELKEMRDKAQPAIDKWEEEVGKDIIEGIKGAK